MRVYQSLRTSQNSFLLFVLLSTLLASGCGEHRVTGVEPTPQSFVQPQGAVATFELATWNIENFPLGSSTVELVSKIIAALDIDLYAIQEIEDTTAFRDLLDRLPEYDGLSSWDEYYWGGYQKTGIIYKRSVVSVSQTRQLFEDDGSAFPRPPLEAHMVAEKAGRRFDFVLIVMHLKAGNDEDDLDRRRQAAQRLKSYLDAQVAANAEKDYLVAGDWNDEIDDPSQANAFSVFVEDTLNYRFLTTPLVGQFVAASFPRYGTLIDHILISQDGFVEYQGGLTRTLRLNDELANYISEVSDHRPVMATFPVFE
jgi:endonuclease/exonuclease/phosphatase family metal-dependent hydrolase